MNNDDSSLICDLFFTGWQPWYDDLDGSRLEEWVTQCHKEALLRAKLST